MSGARDPGETGELNDDATRDAAAAEYVLGTLDDHARIAFERALTDESSGPTRPEGAGATPLRAAVYAWQDRLLGLAASALPVVPEAWVWLRIDRTLEEAVASRATAPAATLDGASPRASADAAPDARTPQRAADRVPWFDRLRFWQGAGAFAMAAAVLMAVLLLERPRPAAATGDRYLALLQSPSTQSTGWVVEIEAGRTLQLIPVAAGDAVPNGKALQFWTKPQGAAAPTSLGLVAAGRAIELPAARLPGIGASQLFEITLEPSAGSPIGKPTGPILYVGRTIHL